MKTNLEILKTAINNVIQLTANLTSEELNKIPEGYSNNLIWHLAHLLVTQKLLIYGLSGNELKLEDEFVSAYRKGSAPVGVVEEQDCNVIFDAFKTQYNQLEKDIEKGMFKSYKPYMTSFNYEINSLESAIAFNNVHYGLHISTILKIRKELGLK